MFHSPEIELYFYDELDPAARARVSAHLAVCISCRQRLEDLETIRHELAQRPRVDAPPAGDWSGFMRRLDEVVGTDTRRGGFDGPASLTGWSRPSLRGVVAIAAALMLVTVGVFMAAKFRSNTVTTNGSQGAVAAPVAPVVTPAKQDQSSARNSDRTADRALVALSEQHFERSKLVVLGLTSRDPEHTNPKDWEYERDLAGTLLSDTRLYRLAAQDRGLADIAHVMGDLETVLLEASLSDHSDQLALERVQNLIRKRDLVVKMQVVGSAGI
jgi:hypothetical protein